MDHPGWTALNVGNLCWEIYSWKCRYFAKAIVEIFLYVRIKWSSDYMIIYLINNKERDKKKKSDRNELYEHLTVKI